MIEKWRPARRDERGVALLLVIMLILVAASLSVLLLGMVLSQDAPTINQRKYARTLDAAEAGLNAGLAQIKAATTADSNGVAQGDRSKLPCGTLTGTVGGEPGNVGYAVTISYFTADPTNTTTSWRTANALGCVSGYGPSQVPGYALLQAQGTADSAPGTSATTGNRSMESVYSLQVTNANLAGGLIENMYGGQGSNLALCFDAGSTTPAANAVLVVNVCNSGLLSQRFSYQTNYSIVLNATQTTATPAGMCVTYDATKPTLVMRACDNTNSQKWGIDASAHFRYPWSSGLCIKIQTDNAAGSNLIADAASCNAGYSRQWAWTPEAKVGAGNAGPNQSQLVNYLEFGRCFDDTGWNLASPYMISWPCKQDPTGGPGWNQQQTYVPASGQLIVDTTYCVTTPSTTNGYVTLSPCVNGQANQGWIETGNTGDYTSSYTIVDDVGRCLGLGPTNASVSPWSTIIAAPCDGTLGQKWNAPANTGSAMSKNIHETTGQ